MDLSKIKKAALFPTEMFNTIYLQGLPVF